MLAKFSKLDKNKDGSIDAVEFAELLGVPNSGYTRDLFRLFDEDQDGRLDVREFIIGISLLSKKCPSGKPKKEGV